jgi:xylitol oxidase
LVSLQHLNQVITINREQHTVTVEAGVRYGQLCHELHMAGFALHNLASLPHISIAGACATATHGSGDRNGNLATAVTAVEIVTADGERVVISREQNADHFDGVVVALGGLGVVTKLTLQVVPAFEMRQHVYQNLPLAQLEQHFDDIASSGYSVSFFTDWSNAMLNQVWIKSRVGDDTQSEQLQSLYGAAPATTNLHPIPNISPINCTQPMGVPGDWYDRLPHFRMNFTPSSGEELQSEYLLPRQHAFGAFEAIDRIREHVAPLLQVSEIRTVAADTLWMSQCYQQQCVAIHLTWKPDWQAVKKVLPLLESQLAPYNARPHWGKLFTMEPDRLQSLYEKLPNFRNLLQRYDPQGKFRNEFLDTYIFGSS